VDAAPAPVPTDDPFDWEGWEAEDLAYWEGREEGESLGRLTSEAMDLDAVVVKGTSRSDLMKGPGWITYSNLPGPEGNFGVAGHRTTYGAPFRDIDQLSAGDLITFTSPFRVYTYEVQRVFSVTPDRVDVMLPTDEILLTMSACHPPYSARFRLIVQSELISVQKIDK
jgi:sortase A